MGEDPVGVLMWRLNVLFAKFEKPLLKKWLHADSD